jgi:hypothetical protein
MAQHAEEADCLVCYEGPAGEQRLLQPLGFGVRNDTVSENHPLQNRKQEVVERAGGGAGGLLQLEQELELFQVDRAVFENGTAEKSGFRISYAAVGQE